MESCTEQHLCNIVNAFAKLQVSDERLFLEVAEEIAQKADTFTPQGLANVFHAYGKLNFGQEQFWFLFEKLGAQVLNLPLISFENRHLANILDGYSKLNLYHHEACSYLARGVRERCYDHDEETSLAPLERNATTRKSLAPINARGRWADDKHQTGAAILNNIETTALLSAVVRFPEKKFDKRGLADALAGNIFATLHAYRFHELQRHKVHPEE